ncbi:internal virion protein D [Pectobacterium phage PP47]|uniref:Internal virion protein D n=2 Tax=Pektosvirus TaxID=2732689 RepID=A0A1L7DSA4_9CAUD|nr:internal virion protein with endolysin domain [Pectobacterium phage PP81]YP_009788745.1 internal virion protein with endolysin domain [Pectobacterium phage PP47]APU03063.1 internal virion protein D [Pectobacterium phage PP81]APW79783.1 internal virion protein D [Pectobacterium phage PP47]
MAKYDENKPSEFDSLYQSSAASAGANPRLLRAQGFHESSFNPKAVSPTGPRGIAQFTKGTARAMGLNVFDEDNPNDDRYNPEKAIPAQARLMADLTKKFGGDELKALLAYNQGEGKVGAAQLEAYDRGDYAKISPEGLGYMRNMSAYAKSPNTAKLEAFAKLSNPKSLDQSMSHIAMPETKAKLEAPELGGLTLATGRSSITEEVGTDFRQEFDKQHGKKAKGEDKGETLGDFESRDEGFKNPFRGQGQAIETEFANSAVGTGYRAFRDGDSDLLASVMTPSRWNTHEFTPDEIEYIRNNLKNADYLSVVSGADSETLEAAVKLANDNYENDVNNADSGWAAQLTAGVLGSAVDPFTYTPIGFVGKGGKLVNKALKVGAASGAANVASEALRTNVSGGEGHYDMAFAGGAVLGGGLTLAFGRGARDVDVTPNEPNPFMPTARRLEARETARNTDGVDGSKMNTEDMDFPNAHDGVDYAMHPTEEGAVILKDGTVLAAENPLNPNTAKDYSELFPEEAERAARGVALGSMTSIGQVTNRSINPEVRGVASELFRPEVGTESGASGRKGFVVDEGIERLGAQDNRFFQKYDGVVNDVLKDPEYSMSGMRQREAQIAVQREAAELIESGGKPKTPAMQKLMDALNDFYGTKQAYMENPAMLSGNSKAKSLLSTHWGGKYVQVVYDKFALRTARQRLGNEGLQEAIAKSWIASAHMRPETMTRVKSIIVERSDGKLKTPNDVTPEMIEKYAMDKAYGISHSDDFTASSLVDQTIDSKLTGIENNKYLEARSGFDGDVPVPMDDGTMFRVNDLRDYDLGRLMPSYARSVNGNVSLMAGTGRTMLEQKNIIQGLADKARASGDPQLIKEVNALKEGMKLIAGHARRDPDGAFGTLMRSLSDLAYFTKNFWMGPMNFTEIGAMVAKGNVRATLRHIPVINDLMYRRKAVSATTAREMTATLFGRDIDESIRPSRMDFVDSLKENSAVNNWAAQVVGSIRYGTSTLAAKSPASWLLRESSNYLGNTARQGVIGNIADSVLRGKNSRWMDAKYLKSAAITKEQAEGIRQLIRDHMELGADGKFTLKDSKAFSQDPRSNDLWRLGQHTANETFLRPSRIGLQNQKAFGWAGQMVAQFKNFVIRSINGRLVKSFYETTKNGRAVDMAAATVISIGLASAFHIMRSHVDAYRLPQGDRDDYLNKALSPQMVGYAGLSRSSHLGGVFTPVQFLGPFVGFNDANMVRTSIAPQAPIEKQPKNKALKGADVAKSFGGELMNQIPAVGLVGNAVAAGSNLYDSVTSSNKPTQLEMNTGALKATQQLVPNDPLTQQIIMWMYADAGLNTKISTKK